MDMNRQNSKMRIAGSGKAVSLSGIDICRFLYDYTVLGAMARQNAIKVSKRTIDALTVDTVFWDRELSGFGMRVYATVAAPTWL